MKRRETCRSDSRLHRSHYMFEENPKWYCMETAHIKGDKKSFNTTAYYKPGQYFKVYEKKFDDYTMYRSRQGLIDVEIRDIMNGYGDSEDFLKYERFMTNKEKEKAFEGLDLEDQKEIIKIKKEY